MIREMSVLLLLKGNERYLYLYDVDSRDSLKAILESQAADSQLSLSWFDAAVLVQKAKEQQQIEDNDNRVRKHTTHMQNYWYDSPHYDESQELPELPELPEIQNLQELQDDWDEQQQRKQGKDWEDTEDSNE